MADHVFYEDPKFEGRKDQRFKANTIASQYFVPLQTLDEYREKYKHIFDIERTEDGIMTAKWFTEGFGDELCFNLGFHRAQWQFLRDVGQDADTEVFIWGPKGKEFLGRAMTLIDEEKNLDWMAYEHMFYDGPQANEALLGLRIPTIGVIRGNAMHSELALMCDITIMAEDALIHDLHFPRGGIPAGDGVNIAFRELMGPKRANYAMYIGQEIDAKTAMEYGIVNEVVPADKVYDRALEIAKGIMKAPRQTRRLQSELCKYSLRRAFADENKGDFGLEMWTFFTNHTDHEKLNEEMERYIAEQEAAKKDQ